MVLVFAVGLSACASSDDEVYLPALLEESVANLELEGAELTRRVETTQIDEGIQSRAAKVLQIFEIDIDHDAEAVRSSAVAVAEADGWDFESHDPQPSVRGDILIAEKEIDTGRAQLTLNLWLEEERYVLVVILDHSAIDTGTTQ